MICLDISFSVINFFFSFSLRRCVVAGGISFSRYAATQIHSSKNFLGNIIVININKHLMRYNGIHKID